MATIRHGRYHRSHRTHGFRHDWNSSNHALTIDDLAACLLTLGVRVSTDFSPHATVPPRLSAGSKGLRYSPRLSEVVLSHNRRSDASLGALLGMLLFRLPFGVG